MSQVVTAARVTSFANRLVGTGGPKWAPVWVARATFLVGLLGILGTALPIASKLDVVPHLIPPVATETVRAVTITAGLVLMMLARGLRHRKRRAWILVVALTAAVTGLHLARDLDVTQAFMAALLLLLFITRRSFTGESEPRTKRRTLVVALGAALLAIVVGSAVILLDTDSITGDFSSFQVVQEVLYGLVGVAGPLAFHPARHVDFVATTLALLGAVVLLSAVAAALRPAGGPQHLDVADEERMRGLLAGYEPHDSLGYFALRRDKSVIFSPSGKAAIGYRVIGGVCLAAGDPLGDPEAWPGVIGAWLDQARKYAWMPAVLAAGERGASAYHRAGLDAFELGDEAIVRTDEFTLEGRAMRGVRQAISRARRAGYTVDIAVAGSLAEADLATLRDAADSWRDGTQERGFAMALGRFGDPQDAGSVVVRCQDADGALVALLTFVPWGCDGLSLDLMRRDPDSDNGIFELMVTELLTSGQIAGLRRISLNFAVFRAVFDRGSRLGAGPVLRLWRAILLQASRFWQIESLYRANAKYQPEWTPRYLCFASSRDLPQVLIAALRAEALLTAPSFWRRLRRRG